MNTKLQQNSIGSKLPAGILAGTEAFWFEGEKMVIHNGHTTTFDQAPSSVRNMIKNAFLADKRSHKIMAQHGLTKASEVFSKWYHCVIGALDSAPDFIDGNLNADAYNHMCTDTECPMRGKLCSIAIGLSGYEVETIKAMQEGMTMEQAADRLCLSVPGLKSRIDKLKEKLDAKNMAELIAHATRLGI